MIIIKESQKLWESADSSDVMRRTFPQEKCRRGVEDNKFGLIWDDKDNNRKIIKNNINRRAKDWIFAEKY